MVRWCGVVNFYRHAALRHQSIEQIRLRGTNYRMLAEPDLIHVQTKLLEASTLLLLPVQHSDG